MLIFFLNITKKSAKLFVIINYDLAKNFLTKICIKKKDGTALPIAFFELILPKFSSTNFILFVYLFIYLFVCLFFLFGFYFMVSQIPHQNNKFCFVSLMKQKNCVL